MIETVPDIPGRLRTASAMGGAAAGLLLVWIAGVIAGSGTPRQPWDVIRFALALAVLLVMGLGAVLVRRGLGAARAGTLTIAFVAALLSATVLPSAVHTISLTRDRLDRGTTSSLPALGQDAVAATTWLRTHTPSDDIVATNVHCQPSRRGQGCDARAYWVSGLGERRTYLESWAYADETQRQHSGHVGSYAEPFWDRHRFQLNDSAFTAPRPQTLAWLHQQGVRWLFADDRSGRVSPMLAHLCDVHFHQGPISIYRLRD